MDVPTLLAAVAALWAVLVWLVKQYITDMKANCDTLIKGKDEQIAVLQTDNKELLARVFRSVDVQEKNARVTGRAVAAAEVHHRGSHDE